jgi:hypothetical protein
LSISVSFNFQAKFAGPVTRQRREHGGGAQNEGAFPRQGGNFMFRDDAFQNATWICWSRSGLPQREPQFPGANSVDDSWGAKAAYESL